MMRALFLVFLFYFSGCGCLHADGCGDFTPPPDLSAPLIFPDLSGGIDLSRRD